MPSKTPDNANAIELIDRMVADACRRGADAADGVAFESASLTVSQRLGKSEGIERAESCDIGLRVFKGRRQAIVSSTDLSPAALDDLVERCLAMASAVPEDPYCGLPDKADCARVLPGLDLDEGSEPTAETLVARATAAEDAARAVEGVSNSEGAEAAWNRTTVSLVSSKGFKGGYTASECSVAVSVVAGEGTAMERDYAFASARYSADLEESQSLGRRAGERCVRRLNPRKVGSASVPIIFEPRTARSPLSHLVGAISGPAIARGTSFLKDSLETQVFAQGVNIVDDPHRPRGLRSKPFDGEGVANRSCKIISDGNLMTWLLDCRSARQLGLKTTGHAARGTSAPPSPGATNLYLEAGRETPEQMISGIAQGLFVTELIGMGVNPVTGDYSRGAAGIWIENGELAYPVSEVTVAGNLKSMFRHLTPANDLVFRYGFDAPTVRIDGMTVAGT